MSTSCPTLSQSPRRVPACRSRRLLLSHQVSSASSLSKIPFSSVSHLPISSSIEVLATKSSAARHRLSLSFPAASSLVFLRPSDPSWCCRQCPKSDPCSSTSSSLQQLQDIALASETSPPCHRRPFCSDQPPRCPTRVESRMTSFHSRTIRSECFAPFCHRGPLQRQLWWSATSDWTLSIPWQPVDTLQQRNKNTLTRRKCTNSSCNLSTILCDNATGAAAATDELAASISALCLFPCCNRTSRLSVATM